MKCGSAAEGGRRHCGLRSVIKFLSFNDSYLLDFVNKKGICVLLVFSTVDLKTSEAICRFLEERTNKFK